MGRQIQVPNFDIYLNGSKLGNEVKKYISQVTVKEDLDAPSSFSFSFDTVNLQQGKWQGIDLELFTIGDSIDIYLGMDQTVQLISGSIDSMHVNFGDKSSVDISGFSWLHKLTFGTRTQAFKNMSDSDIAAQIARQENLSADVDSTDTQYEQINQNNQSNFQFLLARAKRISYELSASHKQLIFRKSQENDAPAASLQFGVSLFDFSVSLNNLEQGSSVEVRGWDMLKKEAFSGTAGQGDEDSKMGKPDSGFSIASEKSPMVLQASDPADLHNAQNLARDKYNDLLLEFLTGSGQCLGNNRIRAGKTIEITGIGSKFSGVYYVSSVTHTLGDADYQTQFSVKKTAI
ncbi:phage late control D family protein [Pseudoalteromonas sp. S16_S37]|uniref:phage late control D family protein n=1 Tax=Pseudoalteromonas sp. S16_S37 TaxID=2720228 RepID=UPI001680D481|nr:contractile injection system protein, VgrG/Pvc8 family [Pseudoalteromonas sp. S16_S37]MBD1580871.1 phage late control D family protein [Pseudoalteromonas sp. S16_S37]